MHRICFQFSTLLILVFILELAAGIAGYALRDTTTDFLTDKLTESLDSYNVSGDGEVTVMWDLIQKEVSVSISCFLSHQF